MHHPPLAPHWVKNGDNVSVSVSVSFCIRSLDHRAKVYQANRLLRRSDSAGSARTIAIARPPEGRRPGNRNQAARGQPRRYPVLRLPTPDVTVAAGQASSPGQHSQALSAFTPTGYIRYDDVGIAEESIARTVGIRCPRVAAVSRHAPYDERCLARGCTNKTFSWFKMECHGWRYLGADVG